MNPIVSVQWLFENLENPNLVILDASPKENKSNLVPEFTDIQIQGARWLDMESVFVETQSAIPNMFPSPSVFTEESQKLGINADSVIVVYDNLGIYTSPRAWWMFRTMGHYAIAVLDGGLSAWKKAGYPCEKRKKNAVKRGDFKANYQPQLVKDAQFILHNMDKREAIIIDARSEDRFNGVVSEPRANMQSGHIPNSVNLPFRSVLDEGKMKSKKELEHLFKELTIENKELVFTCGSGITACILLLASELTQSNPKALYDGSWAEWGQLNQFPVEC